MALLDRGPGDPTPGQRSAHLPDQREGRDTTLEPSETRNGHSSTHVEAESRPEQRGRARKMLLRLGGVAALAAAAGAGAVNYILGPSEGDNPDRPKASATAPRVVLPPPEASPTPDALPSYEMPKTVKPKLDYVPSLETDKSDKVAKALAEQLTWAANAPDAEEAIDERLAKLFRYPEDENQFSGDFVHLVRDAASKSGQDRNHHTFEVAWDGPVDRDFTELPGARHHTYFGDMIITISQVSPENPVDPYVRQRKGTVLMEHQLVTGEDGKQHSALVVTEVRGGLQPYVPQS